MNVDEIVKLILVFAVAFSVAGISFQVMRLIGGLADAIQDTRRALQNVSNLSDLLVEDYKNLSKAINSLVDILTNLKTSIFEPLSKLGVSISTILAFLPGLKKQKKSTSPQSNDSTQVEPEE